MKTFHIHVKQTVEGYYIIRADTEEDAIDLAQGYMEMGEHLDKSQVTDGEIVDAKEVGKFC